MMTYLFCSKGCMCRILIHGARFPPFGLDIAEISSSPNEDISIFQIRWALCPGRVRFCHHPLSHVPVLGSFYLVVDLVYPWGPWIRKCAPWWLPGGSLAAPCWIPVVGRDAFDRFWVVLAASLVQLQPNFGQLGPTWLQLWPTWVQNRSP